MGDGGPCAWAYAASSRACILVWIHFASARLAGLGNPIITIVQPEQHTTAHYPLPVQTAFYGSVPLHCQIGAAMLS
jgi:hypothetical protein